MKPIYALATAALLAGAALPVLANAADGDDKYAVCAQNQEDNAALIARIKNEPDAKVRHALLEEAYKKDPANAICIADMLLQLANAQANLNNVQPAAGDEDGGNNTPDDNTPPPVNPENPNQLNTPAGDDSVSPNEPNLQ